MPIPFISIRHSMMYNVVVLRISSINDNCRSFESEDWMVLMDMNNGVIVSVSCAFGIDLILDRG